MRHTYIDQTYTVYVCPETGEESELCEGHGHASVPLEVAPLERLREVERGRDSLAEQVRRFREDRGVALTVGEWTLYGSRDAVQKAQWTIAHLKAKAREKP